MSRQQARKPVIGVVAPSGGVAEPGLLDRSIARLEQHGCLVKCWYAPSNRFQRFGASDAVRLAQLHAAAADPEIDIVLALRGGYGLSRILPELDLPALAGSGKRFVGHSDFTALHLALLKHGAPSFAGPMLCMDFAREDACEQTLDDFWRCLRGPEHVVCFDSTPGDALDVEGPLWGGNLSMLVHLIGTPWMPHVEGGILFLEDVNEHPYRVERMLLQMEYAGLLRQRAIVLGDFSGYRLSEYDNGYDFETMLTFMRGRLNVPLLTGLPFGHLRSKRTLVVGSRARVRSDGSHCHLVMTDYPVLP